MEATLFYLVFYIAVTLTTQVVEHLGQSLLEAILGHVGSTVGAIVMDVRYIESSAISVS
jgi:hypothetical protein